MRQDFPSVNRVGRTKKGDAQLAALTRQTRPREDPVDNPAVSQRLQIDSSNLCG